MNCAIDNVLKVELQLIDEKVKFLAKARTNPELVIDYFPPFGTGEGYTSMELLLASFSSCVSTTMLTILRAKMSRTISALHITANGTVREEHPKSLSHIHVKLDITSCDLEDAEVKNALVIAEEKLCPVWAMSKGNVVVDVSFQINK